MDGMGGQCHTMTGRENWESLDTRESFHFLDDIEARVRFGSKSFLAGC
jgi:hypothetical protein